MENILASINQSLSDKNWYVALFVTLTLPDICGKLENPTKNSSTRYIEWFEANMQSYKGFLSGKDCYALRCAVLHEGTDDITEQRIKEVLDYCVFLTSGPHLNLFKDCYFGSEKVSFLQINVSQFCNDLCKSVKDWLSKVKKDRSIMESMTEAIEIHNPGFVHKGIKFG